MANEVYPGIYVNGIVEIGDGKGNKNVKPAAVTLLLADGWTVTLNVLQGMQAHSGDLDVTVANGRITGEDGAIRVTTTCRDGAKYLGWLVRRYTVMKKGDQ